MKKRDIVLVSVLSCGVAVLLLAIAAYLYIRRRRRKREDEDGARHAIRADPSSGEDGLLKSMNRLNGFLNLKTPLISTMTLGYVWSFLMTIMILINCSIVNNTMSFTFGDLPVAIYVAAVVIEFIVMFDIYIQFKTGYIDKETRKVVLSTKKNFLEYSSSKLFLHCVSAIPLQTILFIRYGSEINCILCKANEFVCTLRLLTSVRLFHLYYATKFWIREGRSFKALYTIKFIRICILGIVSSMNFFNMTTSITLLYMIHKNVIYEDSYLALMLRYRFWNNKPYTLAEFILIKISKVIKSYFFFGYTYNSAFYLDKLFALIEYFIASLFLFWGIMTVFAVTNRYMFANDKMHNQKERTISMMKCMQISDQVSKKVLDYYHYNMSRLSVIETANELYRFLPTSILTNIKVTTYSHIIKRIQYFQDWPSNIIEDLVMLLKEDVYLPEDTVSQPWYAGNGLIIVETGVLAVFTPDGQESGHLIDGDYFGLLSLVTDKEVRSSYVVATTRCKILTLYKNDFRYYMQAHPNLFFNLRRRLRRHHHWMDPDENIVTSEKIVK